MTCKTCGVAFEGQVSVYSLLGRTKEVKPRDCPACTEAREAENRRLAEEEWNLQRLKMHKKWREQQSGIPWYLWTKTLDNFDQRFQRTVFDAVARWVDGFTPDGVRGYPSLMIYSDECGVGKTHLAVGVANRIMDTWEADPDSPMCPIRFESGPGLVRRIRATYNIPEDQPYHETEEMVYRQLRGVRLLILDDVGKEKASAHTREVYFYLVDERLKMGLPVFITSNLPLEGQNSLEQLMGEATVSRLIGMTRGNYFKLKGEDFRRREKMP